MSIASDISGLFKWFGGRPEQYQEMAQSDLNDVLPEPCVPEVKKAVTRPAVDLTASANEETRALAESEPPSNEAPPETDIWSSAGLQTLLARLAQESPEAAQGPEEPEEHAAASLDQVTVLAIVSAKGGVGKTTLTANLAVALHQAGRPVVVVDLDPQNALRHHFKPAADSVSVAGAGIAHHEADGPDCSMQSDSGVVVLPYGEVDEEQRLSFERALGETPDWLGQRLLSLRLAENTVILLDTPPGPSVYLRQALSVANEAIVVSLADAASYTALPQIDRLIDTYTAGRDGFSGTSYLVNQVDDRRQLSRQIAQIMHELLGPKMLGMVRHDPAIGDALAYNRNVLEYEPLGDGSSDILECSQALVARLVNAPAECAE